MDHELKAYLDDQRTYLETKFEGIDQRFEALESRFEKLESRSEKLESRSEDRFEALGSRFEALESRSEGRFEALESAVEALRDERRDHTNRQTQILIESFRSDVRGVAEGHEAIRSEVAREIDQVQDRRREDLVAVETTLAALRKKL